MISIKRKSDVGGCRWLFLDDVSVMCLGRVQKEYNDFRTRHGILLSKGRGEVVAKAGRLLLLSAQGEIVVRPT